MDDPDSQPELVRLSKVASECNVALYAIIEELAAKGVPVEANPNAKIPYALYQELLSAFQQDKEMRERSREAFELHKARYPVPAITLNPSAMNAVWIIEKSPGKADARLLVHDAADQEITAAGLASVLDENVADRKRKEENTGDHIILIDIFLTFQDPEYQHRQDLGGIALLKFLRIKEVSNHIVLLSPWNLQQLLRMDPGYHILASKGITIAQYTYSLDELTTHDGGKLDTTKLAELAKEKAPSKDRLREWFKAGISLPKDERHNWANWWGAECMRLMHNKVHSDREIQQPESIVSRLKELKCAGLMFVYSSWPEITTASRILINHMSANQKVLYVDDNCDLGWKDVLASFIYGSKGNGSEITPYEFKNGSLASIKPSDAGNKEAFYTKVLAKLKNGGPYAFVLLDVRLFAEPRTTPDADLSGIELLRRIRAAHPTLPVILFTATARADFFKAYERLGLVEYWTKPSPEDSGKEDSLTRSYTRLRRLLMDVAKQTRDPFGVKFTATRNMIDQIDSGLIAPSGNIHSKLTYDALVNSVPPEWMDSDQVTVDTNFFEDEDIHEVLPVLYFVSRARKKAGKSPIAVFSHVVGEMSNHQERAVTQSSDRTALSIGRRASFVLPFLTSWVGDGLMGHYKYAYEKHHLDKRTQYYHKWEGGRPVGTPVPIAMNNHLGVPMYRKNAMADDIFLCEFVEMLKQNDQCKVLLFSNENDENDSKIIKRMSAGMTKAGMSSEDQKRRFSYVRIDALKPMAETLEQQLSNLSY